MTNHDKAKIRVAQIKQVIDGKNPDEAIRCARLEIKAGYNAPPMAGGDRVGG